MKEKSFLSFLCELTHYILMWAIADCIKILLPDYKLLSTAIILYGIARILYFLFVDDE